ncbi:nascent polypeptide-associated complex subunit alpha, muscle-specific form-like [Physeter macrocephalus]|uniref:Nascent polypeptide-associated complex subunit alpha, muscle-specific form-like n=1 Tax=Physeter macrocephalus TaxID=9755 RepID=A0A455C1S8_PHYMC|nr:nascent polypeptide-associated complex subunit alpha, muscle-specific form-like [Physeter catodon]|eukprot:XP_028354967.1 nascent polypeptide-associated complex subunit alpha, muscle-specific form-like [Physeter catodon]
METWRPLLTTTFYVHREARSLNTTRVRSRAAGHWGPGPRAGREATPAQACTGRTEEPTGCQEQRGTEALPWPSTGTLPTLTPSVRAAKVRSPRLGQPHRSPCSGPDPCPQRFHGYCCKFQGPAVPTPAPRPPRTPSGGAASLQNARMSKFLTPGWTRPPRPAGCWLCSFPNADDATSQEKTPEHPRLEPRGAGTTAPTSPAGTPPPRRPASLRGPSGPAERDSPRSPSSRAVDRGRGLRVVAPGQHLQLFQKLLCGLPLSAKHPCEPTQSLQWPLSAKTSPAYPAEHLSSQTSLPRVHGRSSSSPATRTMAAEGHRLIPPGRPEKTRAPKQNVTSDAVISEDVAKFERHVLLVRM